VRVRVRCTYEVEIELPDGADAQFVVEENGCPGTGSVGRALEEAMEEHERDGTCWACALGGENKIVAVVP